MNRLRLTAATFILTAAFAANVHAQDNITVPVRDLCVGKTVEPNHLREPRIVIPGTGEANATIGNDGAIRITGVKPGNTVIVVERTTLNEMHVPVRTLITYVVNVIQCDPPGTGGDTGGGTGGGSQDRDPSKVDIQLIELRLTPINPVPVQGRPSRVTPIAPLNVDSFFDITYRIDRTQQPALLDNGEKGNGKIDCEKLHAWRGTAATGGMIIHGEAGSVPAGSKVTITDGKGNTVTTTANDDGSFTVKESELPDGFDHTIGNGLTVSVGKSNCTVTIERDRIGAARGQGPEIG